MMQVCRFASVVQAVKAKAVAVASACLYHMLYSSNVLITYIILSITLILTHTPDWMKMDWMYVNEGF
jgi:hypothetical protein